jgi:hypothetical protein
VECEVYARTRRRARGCDAEDDERRSRREWGHHVMCARNLWRTLNRASCNEDGKRNKTRNRSSIYLGDGTTSPPTGAGGPASRRSVEQHGAAAGWLPTYLSPPFREIYKSF